MVINFIESWSHSVATLQSYSNGAHYLAKVFPYLKQCRASLLCLSLGTALYKMATVYEDKLPTKLLNAVGANTSLYRVSKILVAMYLSRSWRFAESTYSYNGRCHYFLLWREFLGPIRSRIYNAHIMVIYHGKPPDPKDAVDGLMTIKLLLISRRCLLE